MKHSFNTFEDVAEYLKELQATTTKTEEDVEEDVSALPKDKICKNCKKCFGRHFDPELPNWPQGADYYFCKQKLARVSPWDTRECFC